MADLLKRRNGDFELGENGDWTHDIFVGDGGAIEQANSRTGMYSLRLESATLNQDSQNGIGGDWIAVSVGTLHTLSGYVKVDQAVPGYWIEFHTYPFGAPGTPTSLGKIYADAAAAGTWMPFSYTVTPLATDDAVYLESGRDVPHGVGVDPIVWSVDNVRYDDGSDDVAVMLAERGIDAVVALLQANLGTELGLIDTDRADGITMAAPPNYAYHKRQKPEIVGGTAHIEVYEDEFAFKNFGGDTSESYTDLGAQRAVYELPVTIRLTWFNRDQDDGDEMAVRGRRYSAGVFNTLAKTPTLDAADDALQAVRPLTVSPPWHVTALADGIFKGQMEFPIAIDCEEVQ